MRSAESIISRVCALRPNSFESFLADYLANLDLRIKSELFGESSPSFDPSSLALDAPEDEIYELYLFSVIDFLNGEFGRYENTCAVFASAWEKLVLAYAPPEDDGGESENGGGDISDGASTETEQPENIYDRRIKIW